MIFRSLPVLLTFCMFPAILLAGSLSLSPPQLVNGGVAMLRWNGAAPASAVGRWNDRPFYLRPLPGGGAFALLGADMLQESGTYPLEVVVADGHGQSTSHRLMVEVVRAERPVQRLTLPAEMVTPRDPETIRRIERERALIAEVYARMETPPLWTSFVQPVDDSISSVFGLQRILNGEPRTPHNGIDFRSPLGTPVRAAADGIAVLVDDLYYTGKTVILDHGEGLFSLYAHLHEFLCESGQQLRQGDILGKVGSTGRSTGAHLHWGMRLRGERVDPLLLLQLLNTES
jgi:murein DD-endopeptidase MepM/ murein hydrolase activator NlpD